MVGYSPWGRKESDTTERLHSLPHSLTHSLTNITGFPRGSAGKNLYAMQQPREPWAGYLGQQDPLEECMATLSSIVAWRIPQTEEPGGLQSMGLQSQT